jgi:hypothetical protein
MTGSKETVTININVEIAPAALEAVVANAKRITGRNEKGHYRVDTADMVSRMISLFLQERDFSAFAADPDNYS